jgi:aspartyl-tRNA(Asn)/glutamyl-tRNA(Gln) amidotransferase subunit A
VVTGTQSQSVAARSFSDAEETLRAQPFPEPRVAPPLSLSILADAPVVPPAPLAAPAASATEWPGAAWTVTGALRAFERGELRSRDLIEAAVAAEAGFSNCGAVVSWDLDAARAEADKADADRAAGRPGDALRGIPVTVKDVIDVAGLPTGAGSLAYSDKPAEDAAGVRRLRDAGAILFAKVATHEFALGVTTPQCRNPYDPTRLAGGSSGGSAIAVAAGIGLASLGTDTRASLRVPSALCGVVAFKPTFGLVPTRGIVPLSWTVDHVGPITRTVRDAGFLLNVLSGGPFLEVRSEAAVTGLRVGFVEEVLADADREVAASCEKALRMLEKLGCEVKPVPVPGLDELELANDLGLLVSRSEAAAYHRSRGTNTSLCIPEVRDQLTAALSISAADYLDAQRQRAAQAKRVLAVFGDCDVIAGPTTPMVAPAAEDYERHLLRLSRYTILWSMIGAPALSIPCGPPGGMPVGLQIVAPPYREQLLFDLGTALEHVLPPTEIRGG